MVTFMSLAVETRLQIYEDLLAFPKPLRLTKNPRWRITPEDSLAVVNTSILLVSKQIAAEALPTFYSLNTIRICHWDICLWNTENTPTGCDSDLLHHAILTDKSIWTPFSSCGRCGDGLYELIDRLSGGWFPKLRSITVDTKGCDSIEELQHQLWKPKDDEDSWREDISEAGDDVYYEDTDAQAEHQMDRERRKEAEEFSKEIESDLRRFLEDDGGPDMYLDFTTVGRFRVVNVVTAPGPEIIFQYPAMARTWEHFEALDVDHEDLEHHADQPEALTGVPKQLFSLLQHAFSARAGWLRHARECTFAQSLEMGVKFAGMMLPMDWFEPGGGSSDLYELITKVAIDWMESY